jgi:serine O-acetyltransferase
VTNQPERCRRFRHHRLAGVRAGISSDILRYLNKSPENQAAGDRLKTRIGAMLTPQLLCLVVYRLSHWLWACGWHRLATALSGLNLVVHKVSIPPRSCIGPGCLLPHPVGVTFHGTAGRGLTLYSMAVCCPTAGGLAYGLEAAPRLGDRVSVGGHAAIVGPVVIGDDTRIAFNLGLDRDVSSRMLVLSDTTRVRTHKDRLCTSR